MAGKQYDYIIVGASLTGALLARRLAEQGNSIVVLEATTSVGGTLSLGPALIMLGTADLYTDLQTDYGMATAASIWQLTAENLVLLERVLEAHGQTGLETGCLRTASGTNQSDAMRTSVDLLFNAGYEVSVQDTPWAELGIAMYTGNDLVFNPYKLVPVLLDHPNIIVELNAEVHRIRNAESGGVTVSAHKRFLQAREVILCNGVHARNLSAQMHRLLHPRIVYTYDVEKAPALHTPMVLQDGHMVILPNESRWRICSWDTDEQRARSMLVAVAEAICPNAVVMQQHTSWVAQSEDRLPLIGAVEEYSGVYTVNGLGAYGLNWVFIAVEQLLTYFNSPTQSPHPALNIQRFTG